MRTNYKLCDHSESRNQIEKPYLVAPPPPNKRNRVYIKNGFSSKRDLRSEFKHKSSIIHCDYFGPQVELRARLVGRPAKEKDIINYSCLLLYIMDANSYK